MRELDREIAEKVMGYRVIETDDCNGEDNYWLSLDGQHVLEGTVHDEALPQYSTDIADAWKVVEKLIDADDCWTFDLGLNAAGEYVCSFDDYTESEGIADTAPEAICRAALQSVK